MAQLDDIRRWWDDDAAVYDDAPNHNPRFGPERAAWTAAVEQLLPPVPARVLDCGAGTGFLSLIAARLGHRVTAVDLSKGMLGRLEDKAAAEGLAERIEVVHASAAEPPAGSWDVVMERHLLWTLPDAAAALGAWRGVAERLVLIESLWGNADPWARLRARLATDLNRWRHQGDDHHAEYPEDLRSSLPLGRGTSPEQLIQAVEAAGWVAPRLIRLRDVEWATRLRLSPLERLLGPSPRFAIAADQGGRR